MLTRIVCVLLLYGLCALAFGASSLAEEDLEKKGLAGLHYRMGTFESRLAELEHSMLPHRELDAELKRLAEQVRDSRHANQPPTPNQDYTAPVLVKVTQPDNRTKSAGTADKNAESLSLFSLFVNGGIFSLAITALVLTILGLFGVYTVKRVKEGLHRQIEDAKKGLVARANIEATGKQLQSFANQAYHAYNTYKRCAEHTKNKRKPGDNKGDKYDTDAWQNYAFMDIAISLSEMAIDSAAVINEQFDNGDHQQDMSYTYYELLDVYAYCNLCFYYAERLQDKCFFSTNELKPSRAQLISRLKAATEKLDKANKTNARINKAWHHLKESLIHAKYFVDADFVHRTPALKETLIADIHAVLARALALDERDWYNATRQKWADLGMYTDP
ncbi:hypothetical protein [Alteromonas halophila]|uniref:Uncharacterized protein n=1 Tax=Alteromonas halophila TaxID=516698 RepID=A0A918JE03_9ALTE|nr:hypothetical protein [Alteromonas halophila]GGW72865.1 hypothetical protein GCM10007391_00470 [Alteromonas halophila]